MQEMFQYVKKETVALGCEFDCWEDSVRYAGGLLLGSGCIEQSYCDDMVNMIQMNGSYIVIMPGVAIAHARPSGNVKKNSIAVVTIPKGVCFRHPENDPVKLLFAVAAVSDSDHLVLFSAIAKVLENDFLCKRLMVARTYSQLVRIEEKNMLAEIENGLIVSCYAGDDFNEQMGTPDTMAHVARSVVAGGAAAVRTNIENIREVKRSVDVPVIGLKKVYKSGDMIDGDFRITPTIKEVEELLNAGADAVAIDGTIRPRYDDMTLEEFIHEIKKRFNAFVIADVSTFEEGLAAWSYGADMIGTTLSGYTPYSKNPIRFGQLPSPEPDYELIHQLVEAGVKYVVAEGRINDGAKMKKALEAGAHSVVIGTSITEPRKIVKTILYDALKR